MNAERVSMQDPPSRLLVLLYHRVADLDFDPLRLTVSPSRFETHMRWLSKNAEAVSLEDGITGLNGIPGTAVAVTFDDGYVDNLLNAAPILESYAVPATVYVSSGPMMNNWEFWWDELEQLLFPKASAVVEVTLELDDVSVHGRIAPRARLAHFDEWSVADEKCPTDSHRLYRDIYRFLRRKPPAIRASVLKEISRQVGRDTDVRASHAPMNSEELRRWDDHPDRDIGAHTVWHPILSTLSAEDQAEEIRTSKHQLEKCLNRKVKTFAYPYGGVNDFTSETVRVVRDSGFSTALVSYGSVATSDSDSLRLERCLVGNWTAHEFERRVSELLDAV